MRRSRAAWAAVLVLLATPLAMATWSIVVVDTRSGEIAIGSATCLTYFNLKKGLAVVRVGIGAAAAQSAVDSSGKNRRLIWDEFERGSHPDEILSRLSETDKGHENRQYGIVDVQGRAVTFTGSGDGAYANGVVGHVGDLVYAIQGNVITGQPVIDAAEQALLATPGALPERLMAAMEAARSMGGDGRCSCSETDPDGCGSPPPNFDKSAHVGFMVVTRRGDVDGECSRTSGCANGDYYMALNVQNQGPTDPDPVLQLRQRFDNWRTGLIGIPDQVASSAGFPVAELPADGVSETDLTIAVCDWQGAAATDLTGVEVAHDDGSAGSCEIVSVTPLGGAVYKARIRAGTTPGIDRFRVTAAWSGGARVLMPSPQLSLVTPAPAPLPRTHGNAGRP